MNEIFRLDVATEVEMAVRLLLAAVFGAIVGFEREQAEKPAGLRTLSLVSAGSALFTIASIYAFPTSDPARVAAQIVTGVGFLGAGTILRSGFNIRGLTTAASIWSVAAIGLAVGSGLYILSVVATVVMLVILHLLPRGR